MKWISKKNVVRIDENSAESLLLKFVFGIGGGLTLIQFLLSLFQANPDGTSYLDIASKIIQGDFEGVINGYWNPLYPALLALTISIVGQRSYLEASASHFLNLALLIVLFFCFRRFLNTVISYSEKSVKESTLRGISAATIYSSAYTLFFWCTLHLTPILYLTPDLLVMLGMVISSHLLFIACQRPHSWREAFMLGIVLGLGYWAKAIMFPYGLVVLFAYFLLILVKSYQWKHFALSVTAFILVCTPLVTAISKKVGRPSFSESGRLAYIWMVNEVTPWFHWQGKEPGSGNPEHPTLQISEDPPVFLFEREAGGTFPPWFDPGYFNAGIKFNFKAPNQIRAILQNFWNIGITLGFPLFFLSGVVFALYSRQASSLIPAAKFVNFLPALILTLLYSIVHYEARYLAGAFLVIFVLMLGLSHIPVTHSLAVSRLLQGATIFSLLALIGGQMVWLVFVAKDNGFPKHIHWQIATQLTQNGLPPKGKVGVVGAGFEAYYARLGNWQVIAEAPEVPMSAGKLDKALEVMFTKTPVDVVIINPRQQVTSRWRTILLPQNYTAIFRKDYLAK